MGMFEEYPDIVGIEELMAMLKIGKSLAYRLIHSGKIEARKVGRQYKIAKRKVIAYILESER